MSANSFLKIFTRANQQSPKVAGQLFTYNAKYNKFEIVERQGAANKFKARWIFLQIISATMILRVVDIRLLSQNESRDGNKVAQQNMCIMMFLMCALTGERYKIRGRFPQDYISYFNGVIEFEKKYIKGTTF